MSVRTVGFWRCFGLLTVFSLMPLSDAHVGAQAPSDLDNLKPGTGAAKRSDAVVKVSAQSGPDEKPHRRRVTIILKIDEGWYIYGNPVGNAEMEGSETVVTLAGGRGKLVEVVYPRGKLCKDKLLDQDIEYRIYEGTVKIEATVEPSPDAAPVEFAIRFGACNHRGSCLQPATVRLSVK